jgi:hypothetical protein
MYLVQRLVRFVGLSRSGNHAVIDWMLRQMSGRWCFFNCIEPKATPQSSARPLHDGRCVIASGVDLQAEAEGMVSPKDWVLLSQEDVFLGPALGDAATRVHEAALGAARQRLDVIIVRDPFNLVASRRKLPCAVISEATTLRIWKQHARAALAAAPGSGRLAVSYAAWAREPGYRRALAAALGLTAQDAGVERVAGCGGGSSFDGMAYDGRAHEMAVFDRWRHFADDPSFWALFDDQVVELCNRLFPGPQLREPLARLRGREPALSAAA